MDMQGSRQLAITQQQAWDALNNPEVLKVCITGCDKVEPTGQNQYAIGMSVKIGPVAAKFAGKILLADIVAPESYSINFEGQGGAAGFGKGYSAVKLVPNGAGCELQYTVHASVGGKIAQLGQRLIDGVAKSMAEDFFKRFDEAMQAAHPEAYAAKTAQNATNSGAEGGQYAKANGRNDLNEANIDVRKTVIAWAVAIGILVAAIWLVRSL
jgi:carbon monoxide dehydrogenase subunit G